MFSLLLIIFILLLYHRCFFPTLIVLAESQPVLADVEERITNLYEFCETTRPAAAALPLIVKRLKALKALHQEAASVTARLAG